MSASDLSGGRQAGAGGHTVLRGFFFVDIARRTDVQAGIPFHTFLFCDGF